MLLEAGHPLFKTDVELFKHIKTAEKHLLSQLFHFDTCTSPRMPIFTVDKTKLLEWLSGRRHMTGNQLAKINLKRAVDWAVSGHYQLKPDAPDADNMEDHYYTHVEYKPTALQVPRGISNFDAPC
jgi:hypothetical protein